MGDSFGSAEFFELFIHKFTPTVGDEETNGLLGVFLGGGFEFHEAIEGFGFVSKKFDGFEAAVLVNECEKIKRAGR